MKSFLPNFKPHTGNVPTHQGLRIIPLGGVGDVTKNMYIYEYGRDIIIIDCGVGFPDEAMLGVDLVIPDITYLKDKVDRIKAIIITHPHDDHIGGLVYIWPELKCPIYATKLAVGFIKNKFIEAKLPKDPIHEIDPENKLNLGTFLVSFYRVSHSVPDSVGIVIDTPAGRVIHQSDFKLDWTPIIGVPTEIGKIARYAEKGIDLLLIDALGSEKQGYNEPERNILPTFKRIAEETKGKMLLTTASSNISRIQMAINVAVEAGRKVSLVGRSMESNFQVARDLGYLHIPPGVIIPQEEVRRYADNKLLLIIAGSQGQPGSALSRVANNDHKYIFLKKDDTVIFSADPIPSTETAQHNLIDKLAKMGVDVRYREMEDSLHVSGHETSEEIKMMINIIKPKALVPIGATFRGMVAFSKLAKDLGYGDRQILLAEDGQIINMVSGSSHIDGRVEVRNIYVDGLGIGDVGNVILRDRKVMSEEGIVLVIVPVDAHTSQLVGEPDIVTRGFVFEREAEELLSKARSVVKSCLADHPNALLDWRFIRSHIEENLDKFFFEEIHRRPMILPLIVEV
ncbi:MAG: ribonuclease J [Microgenomates group bacterium]|jgi:ribonuclease J